jgi:predicted ATPase/class 3 adenylate cyclase/Flp pilus assembly protein TadD
LPSLPTGTVTFLFTDIEGSTRLLQQLGDRYADVLAEHRRLLRATVKERAGQEVETQGDAFFFAFSRARDAVMACVAAQKAVIAHPWPEGGTVRIRMGLHTGEPLSVGTGYVGMDVHRAARICAAGHGGQILVSRAVGDLVAADLPAGVSLRDLGEHRLKDLKSPEHLLQVVHPDLLTDFPPLKSLDARPNNLPIQLTSFIGREHEIMEVKKLLSTARLLTLSGAGGVGKTRVAIQVAAELLETFEDGVWMVELVGLSDPALVPHTVASALRVREQSGRPPLTTLADFLQPKHVLLVLDNCEHLVTACGQLAEALLRVCPTLRILATSREALSIPGEAIWRVPSLSLPDPRGPQSPEALTRYEAVRLFVERAVFSQPGFALIRSTAPAVVQICCRLDGIPLAIELAAARTKVLAVEQIAARLDDRFQLLAGGSRTVLPRHRTLRAAMDWSYDLLLEPERVLLRRLSVFAGGWTLEAAEAVCSGDGVEKAVVLDLLTQLVDKSLLVAETQNGEARYRLLETVRQYGRDRLVESGESDRLHTSHLHFFLRQAEAVQNLSGPAEDVWRQRMETEHDNMRATLEWSWAKQDTEATLRLAAALASFWNVRGYWTEGRKWLEAALAATSGASSILRGEAFDAAGALAWFQGDIGCAVARFEESIALSRALGNKEGMTDALRHLGIVAYRQGNYGRATALLEESLGLSRELGHKAPFTLHLLGIVARLRGEYEQAEALGREALALNQELGNKRHTALSLDSLGLLAYYRGNYPQAHALCEEGLALNREQGDKFGIAGSLNSLALVACGQGDYNRAGALCQESLAVSREVSDKGAMARSLSILGRVADYRGEYERGLALLRESLTLFKELGDKLGIIRCLDGFAHVAVVRELPEHAARIFGATEGLRESIGAALPLADQLERDQNVSAVRAHLGDEALTSSWAEGRAMTLEQAIEYAIEDA